MIKPPRLKATQDGASVTIQPPSSEAYTRYNLKFLLPFDDNNLQAVGYSATPDATKTGILYGRGNNAKYERSLGLFGSLTNLITNPSIETNTTGYAARGTATLTRSSDFAYDRTYSLKYVYGSGTTGVFFENFSFSPSTTYTFSCRVRRADGGLLDINSFQCWVDYGIASGNADFDEVEHEFNGWYKVRYTFTSAGSITDSEVGFGSVDDTTLYFDGWCLTATAYEPPYFDGASGTGFSWSGTADGSTSSKVAGILFYTTPSFSGTSRSIGFWFSLDCTPFGICPAYCVADDKSRVNHKGNCSC